MRYSKYMAAVIIETSNYSERAESLLTADEREALRLHLSENPSVYPAIAGTGGLRKARWQQSARNKGKRGGVRVIYFYAISAEVVALIDIYSKDEKDDLSDADKKELKRITDEIKRLI